MTQLHKFRIIFALLSLAMVWMLAIVVMAQQNKITSTQNDLAALHNDLSTLKASDPGAPKPAVSRDEETPRITALREEVTSLKALAQAKPSDLRDVPDATVLKLETDMIEIRKTLAELKSAKTPDHTADIAALQSTLSDLQSSIGEFEKALHGLHLSITARDRANERQSTATIQ